MFNRILVPLDESSLAAHAAGVAIDMSRKYGTELWAISVVPIPEYAGTVGEIDEVKLEGEIRLKARLEEVKARGTALGVIVKTKLLYGHPAEAIIKFLQANNFDLVIVAHKGQSAINHFLLGSVSSKIIHHAPCTVMMVRN